MVFLVFDGGAAKGYVLEITVGVAVKVRITEILERAEHIRLYRIV